MNFFRSYNYRTDHLKSAIFLALILHVTLAVLLPDIPKLVLQGFDRSSSLTVFLNEKKAEEKFDQSLNQQLPLPANIATLADPSLGSTSIKTGDDAVVSEAVEPSKESSEQSDEVTSVGSGSEGESTPSIRFEYATIRQFAQQEAIRYAALYPREIDRFSRTFNRSRNYRRRTRTESYRDKLGDLYARSNSSDGDICFKQRRELAGAGEFSTNTVYFFSCDKQPQGFEIDVKGSAEG